MSPYMWIERGPGGRPYYVKRKPAVPSLRQKIAEAFRELRQRPQVPSSKPASAPSSPQLPPAPANTPASHWSASSKEPKSSLKQKPQAHPEMARSKTPIPITNAPTQPNFQGQFNSCHHLPFIPPFSPLPIHNENITGPTQNQLSSAVVPHYTTPHPRMYPYVPAGTQALTAPHGPAQHMNMPAIHRGEPSATSQGSQPPNMFAPVPQGQNLVNPLHLNANDLRHKCSNCGRSRSARYHWKHQLTPGEPPGPSICRRCRKEVTDSEGESTDSYGERDSRSRSRARSRLRSQSRARSLRPRSRARSSSRPNYRNVDFDYYATQRSEETTSESDISEPRISRRRKSRTHRSRQPSVEVVRYVDRPSQSRARGRRRIVYVKDHRAHDDTTDEEDELEVRYVDTAPRMRMVTSRPPTMARGLLTRQCSNPELPSVEMIEHRMHGDNIPRSGSKRRALSSSRFSSRNPYRHVRSDSKNRGNDYHESREAEYYYEPRTEEAAQSRMYYEGRSRSRSRGRRRFSIDEGAESGRNMPAAPSPPVHHARRPSAPAYVTSSSDGSAPELRDRRAEPSSKRSRNKLLSREVPSSTEEVPADDYDWYDANGMRVRVREI